MELRSQTSYNVRANAPIVNFNENQDYAELKASHDENNLFEDPFFEANSRSMFHRGSPPRGVRWCRPKEICGNPEFIVNGFGRCDMDQGYVGNCWFIAGAVGIMQAPELFAKVVPAGQGFSENYAGIFHFRFWLYGRWVDVVIDDRLPVWPDGKLLFCSNTQEKNEFWGPLLEKAYAKIYGSYENLEAGQTFDALIDMSGGIQETFDLKKLEANIKANFWQIKEKAFRSGSIMGCSITPDLSVREARMANGLVKGHAYTITKVISFYHDGDEIKLIRIRNPWGNNVEWKGTWSDHSREWNSISEDVKQEIGLVVADDGEFWMSFRDFLSQWDNLQICHLTADAYSDELLETDDDSDLKWNCVIYQSEWVPGQTAGGCGQGDTSKFWQNPQFLIKLQDVDKDDNEDKATLIVSLMQKDTRLRRLHGDEESCEEYIQYRLFKVKDHVDIDEASANSLRLYGAQLDKVGTSGNYINSREITKRFRVDPGNYVIIPSTFDADRSCKFMLRIFTESLIEEIQPLEVPKEELVDTPISPEPVSEEDLFYQDDGDDNMFNNWINFISPRVFNPNAA